MSEASILPGQVAQGKISARAALPRPIFFSERTMPRETALDRAMVALQARMLTPFARLRARRLGRIVATVNGHGASLQQLDDDALRHRAREVRAALRRRAEPRFADIALSFAVIREAAA